MVCLRISWEPSVDQRKRGQIQCHHLVTKVCNDLVAVDAGHNRSIDGDSQLMCQGGNPVHDSADGNSAMGGKNASTIREFDIQRRPTF